MREIQIPFAGFYETKWADIVDHELQQQIEGMLEDAKLDTTKDYPQNGWECVDYPAAYREIARDYVAALNQYLIDETQIDLGLRFVDMTSPRFYNYETDRIFATMTDKAARKLVAAAKKHPKFGEIIRERHTSYDGFHSYYSNDVDEWKAKPAPEFDHNELCTCLLVILSDDSDWEWSIYYRMAETAYEYLNNTVDWPRLESMIAPVGAARDALNDDPIQMGIASEYKYAPHVVALLVNGATEDDCAAYAPLGNEALAAFLSGQAPQTYLHNPTHLPRCTITESML